MQISAGTTDSELSKTQSPLFSESKMHIFQQICSLPVFHIPNSARSDASGLESEQIDENPKVFIPPYSWKDPIPNVAMKIGAFFSIEETKQCFQGVLCKIPWYIMGM